MSYVTSILYTINGTGTEIPALNIAASYDQIYIVGSAVATGNYAIVASGTPVQGNRLIIKWDATLDITSGSHTFSILGKSIDQNLLNSVFSVECYYDTQWVIVVKPNFQDFTIDTTNISNNSITTTQLQDLSVTTNKLANQAVTTSKLADRSVTETKIALNAIGTPELQTSAVTNSIIAANAVDNSKITTNTISNNRLVTGSAHSIKILDGSGLVQDLQLSVNQVPVSNGTTITGIDRNQLVNSINNSQLVAGPSNSAKVTNSAGIVTDIVLNSGQILGNIGSGITAISYPSTNLVEIQYVINPSDWIAIGIAGAQILPSPPTGTYYRIINAQAIMSNSTAPYSGADLYLNYFSAARSYGIFGNLLQNAGNRIVEIDRATSSSSSLTQILPTALIINTAGNTAIGGNGIVKITILYSVESL